MAYVVCLYGVHVLLVISLCFEFLLPDKDEGLINLFTCHYQKGDLSSVVNLQGKDKLHELIRHKVLNAKLKGKKMALDGKFVLDHSGSP